MTQIINSSFKIKVGSVPNLEVAVPEAGAIVFNEADNLLYYGDGFNWLAYTPTTEGAGLTGTDMAYALTLATPIDPAEWFDTIVYELGTAAVPVVITDNITLANTAEYRLNYDYDIVADEANVTVILDHLQGVTSIGAVSIKAIVPGKTYNLTGSIIVDATAADILTMSIEADVTCGVVIQSVIGITELV